MFCHSKYVLVMVLRVPETMQIYFVYISTLFTNSLTVDIYMQLHAMCSFEFTSYLQIFFNIHIVNVPQYKLIYLLLLLTYSCFIYICCMIITCWELQILDIIKLFFDIVDQEVHFIRHLHITGD